MKVVEFLRRNWSFLVLGLAAVAWLYVDHLSDLMHQRAKFTIGYITGWHLTAKSGKYFDFSFTVQNSVYKSSSPTHAGMDRRDGARFVVKYDSLHPQSCVGFFDLRIPDSIRQAPANGWFKPPFPVPAWITDHK